MPVDIIKTSFRVGISYRRIVAEERRTVSH